MSSTSQRITMQSKTFATLCALVAKLKGSRCPWAFILDAGNVKKTSPVSYLLYSCQYPKQRRRRERLIEGLVRFVLNPVRV